MKDLITLKMLFEAPEDNLGDDTEKTPDKQQDMYASDQPKPVRVKFDISKVKRYNPNKVFSQNFGFVSKVSKQGVEVQADNHAVIFVNHEDLLDESKRIVKNMLKEYVMPKQANDALTHFVNFWNEYGPESLGQLDTQTIQSLNQLDPSLGRDVNVLSQILKRLQPFVDDYFQRFLGESFLREEKDNKVVYHDYEDKKVPKLNTDDKTEATFIKKKFNLNQIEVKTGSTEDYNDSSSSPEQDKALALQLASGLVFSDYDCYPTKVEIITSHACIDTYDNPYMNDAVKVSMSNGDTINIESYSGAAPWNPSVKVRFLCVKVGSKELVETKTTSNWLQVVPAEYLKYLKLKNK